LLQETKKKALEKQLSIIIPHYNSKEFLNRLLESIPLKEEWLEVIVIDDQSDVDLSALQKKYRSVNFYKNTGKKGAGSARNVGLEKSRGEYLLFADADDYFTEKAFEVLKKYLDIQSYDIVYFTPLCVKSVSKVVGTRHLRYVDLIEKYLKDADESIRYKFYVPWSKLIATKLVREKQISFEEIIASNDVNFSLQIGFHAQSIYATKENIYCVTESRTSLTKQFSEAVIDSRFGAMCRYNDFMQAHDLCTQQGAMAGHLWQAKRFGLYKFLYRLFYCKYKKYPIFYDLKHFIHALRYLRETKNV